MKIIQATAAPKPFGAAPAGPGVDADLGRLEALEKIAMSILQKLQALEKRVEAVEEPGMAPAPVNEPVRTALSMPPSPSTAMLDTDAVKKGLLTKMWKYLNDDRPPNAV